MALRLIEPAVLRIGCIARRTGLDKNPRRKLITASFGSYSTGREVGMASGRANADGHGYLVANGRPRNVEVYGRTARRIGCSVIVGGRRLVFLRHRQVRIGDIGRDGGRLFGILRRIVIRQAHRA